MGLRNPNKQTNKQTRFFTNTEDGLVFFKLAGLGFFLVQSGRFFVVQKLIDLNLGSII